MSRVVIFENMTTLANKIAVVTGGTAGVGRGIASELANCGARVFVTGRSIQDGARSDSQITGIRCDHREDDQVTAAFGRWLRRLALSISWSTMCGAAMSK